MQIDLAVLAFGLGVSPEGRYTIHDVVFSLPMGEEAGLLSLAYAAHLSFTPDESGKPIKLSVDAINPEGQILTQRTFPGEIEVDPYDGSGSAWLTVPMDLAITMKGTYEARLYLNGALVRSTQLVIS